MADPNTADVDRTPEIVAALVARDGVARRAGIELVDAAAGRVVLRKAVGPDDVNILDVCHGGILFLLADTAMQLVTNGRGVDALATGASIEFLRAAQLGETLEAVAVETARSGRTAVCDVEVTGSVSGVVAVFRGKTLQVGDRS